MRGGGDTVEIAHRYDWDLSCDVAFMIGVKNLRALVAHREVGIPVIYLDKGYTRRSGHWRIAFDAHQPTEYLMDWEKPTDRAAKFGWRFPGWRVRGETILLAGSGMKYHHMNDLGHPTDYASETIAEIRKHTKREIVYRPKPSWKDSKAVAGATFSREKTIQEPLRRAHVLVTYGSNACFDALMMGVPSIVTGDGVLRDISAQSLSKVERPDLAMTAEVDYLLANLAYCQWTNAEFADGSAWEFIKNELR